MSDLFKSVFFINFGKEHIEGYYPNSTFEGTVRWQGRALIKLLGKRQHSEGDLCCNRGLPSSSEITTSVFGGQGFLCVCGGGISSACSSEHPVVFVYLWSVALGGSL